MANYCHVFPSLTNFSLPYKILPLCSYILKSSLSKCWELYFYLIFIRQRSDKFGVWSCGAWHLPACGCYEIREHKIAAVMSSGKNFAVWKTAGGEIT